MDLQRAVWLPAYDEEGTRTVLRELTELWVNLEKLRREEEDGPATVYFEQCVDRNKKYIFSYLLHRLERIREMRFQAGALLPEKIQEKLSTQEMDYFSRYNTILNNYNSALGIDLCADMQV